MFVNIIYNIFVLFCITLSQTNRRMKWNNRVETGIIVSSPSIYKHIHVCKHLNTFHLKIN